MSTNWDDDRPRPAVRREEPMGYLQSVGAWIMVSFVVCGSLLLINPGCQASGR